jgi:peptide/nickel transport system substrate-binding protein
LDDKNLSSQPANADDTTPSITPDISPASAQPLATPPAEPAPTTSQTPTETPPATPVTGTGKAPKKHGLLLFFIILILLGVGGGGYYVWHKHQTDSKASSAAVKKDIPIINYASSSPGWETFYPATDNSNNYLESNLMLFEGLVRFENKSQIVPLLATGWTTPNSTTWVFNLKQGVTFHTGREMTAEDVKLSFDAAKDTPAGAIYAPDFKSVEATGKYQVTITLNSPDSTLLNKLTFYYVYDTKSGKDNDAVNGTGPFVVKPGTTPKPNSLQLVAFDQYHGGRSHVRSFNFIGLDSSDPSGQYYADGKANLEAFDSKSTLNFKRPYAAQDLDGSSVYVMPLNTLKAGSPLQKLAVRQAIQLALDPAAIAKARGVPGTPTAQVITKSIPGFDPTITRPARDVTKAKALLAQAGYPNGTSFTLTYFVSSQATAEEIAKELAEAGITVNLDPQTEVKTLAAKAYSGGTDAYIFTTSSDIEDGSDILAQLINTPNYTNQTVTDLLAKAQDTANSSTRLGYLKAASRSMSTDLGVEPIYTETGNQIIYDPSFVIQRDLSNTSLGVYFWKVYAK